MKVAVLTGIEALQLEERPVPKAHGHDVLIRVSCTGICGTDLGAFRSLSLPVGTIMGHEFAGWVEETGDEVRNCKKGDRVVVRPCSVCFECPWCREGRISLCPHHLDDTVGLKNVDGAYAEFTLVHDFQVFQMDDSMTMEQAAQLEPLAVAVHAVEESAVKEGDRVLLVGAGSIGLLILQCLKLKNPQEIVVLEKSMFRQQKAAELGADSVVDSGEVLNEVRSRYPRNGFDVVIETAGKAATIRQSLSLAAKGGQITLVGLCTEPVELDLFHVVASGVHISNSMGYFVEHWDTAMELVSSKLVNLDGLVTARYPLERIEEGFRALMNPEKNLKIMIQVHEEKRRG